MEHSRAIATCRHESWSPESKKNGSRSLPALWIWPANYRCDSIRAAGNQPARPKRVIHFTLLGQYSKRTLSQSLKATVNSRMNKGCRLL